MNYDHYPLLDRFPDVRETITIVDGKRSIIIAALDVARVDVEIIGTTTLQTAVTLWSSYETPRMGFRINHSTPERALTFGRKILTYRVEP